MDNLNQPIRQISDYSLDELNKHISIVYQIPDYIMDLVRRQYWVDQIKMFKNIILDNIEQKTCMFDRHVKVQKWLDYVNKLQTSPFKYDNNHVYYNDDRIHKKYTYHEFYFEYREKIETYFMDMLEKTGTAVPGLNSEIDVEMNVLEKFQADEKQFLEE